MTVTISHYYPPGWVESQLLNTKELEDREIALVIHNEQLEVTQEEDEAFERLLQLAGISE